MKVWRINVHDESFQTEDIKSTWERLGGRGLIARILVDEVEASCEPFGSKNKLVFAPGLLTGHMLSSCDRISIGGKSPLTGGIKEANAGGTTGLKLVSLGVKALILEGIPQNNEWKIIVLNNDGVSFEDASHLTGLGVYQTAEILIRDFGSKIAASIIGPGGENKLISAGILNLDKDRIPSRIAARGGLGSVMGSKMVKAIVFDHETTIKPELFDEGAFRQAQKIYTKALISQPQTKVYADYGTNAMPSLSNPLGGMPTRNFSSGQFEDVQLIDGNYMRDALLKRGGDCKTTHACMPGCTIRCSNIYGDENGKAIVAPLEYETVGLIGSNLGINNLDTVARINYLINDLGLDTIEIGAALGVAAEAGLMKFGDSEMVIELINEIKNNTAVGRIIGSGAVTTGRIFGIEKVPAVKGQAMSAYDPRAIKGTGVTYATSPQGADHTAGLTIRAKVDHLDPSIQVDLSRKAQINMAGYDSLGVCIFAGFGFAAAPETVKELINAKYNWGVRDDFLQELGKVTLKLELEFNKNAGFTANDDRIPEWMRRVSLPPFNGVFDVPDTDLDELFNW